MKLIYRLLLMFLLYFSVVRVSSQEVWLNRYDGPSNGNDGSNAITMDAAGNTYITGYTTGIGTMLDITTLKYDAAGNLVWSVTYNGSGFGDDEAYAITIDGSGNIYVTGSSTTIDSGEDIITIKYNNNGTLQWVRNYNGSANESDVAYAITVDGNGNVVVTGYSIDLVLGSQMTIIQYSSAGAQVWVDLFNGSGNGADVAYAITVDALNNIYITGFSELLIGDALPSKDMVTIKYNSSGSRQWVNTHSSSGNESDIAYAITVDGSNNIYITGYETTANNGKDYVTIKYNTSGQQQWLSTYNYSSANSDDIPKKIIVDSQGDVLVTGSSKSSSTDDKEDYLTIKYRSSNGNQEFASRYNGASNSSDIAYSLTQYKGSRYYVVGSSRQTTSSGSEDIVVIEYKKNGQFKNKFTISNPGTDAAFDIKADRNGKFVLAGFLAGGTGDATGSQDMGCAKYNPDYMPDNIIGISDIEAGIPNRFGLQQNYPNPFNPSTRIKFDVSMSGPVKIVIFDALGREVLTPVNENLNEGYYELSVTLNNLSSGLYFYKMTSGGFTDIKKMMLIK